MIKKLIYKLSVASLLVCAGAVAQAQTPIRIGEINSYRNQPAFVEPHKHGMELAVEEINAAGGVLGRPLEIFFRDDNANPGDAVRVAEELVSREKVDLLTGVMLSHVGLAIADFANRKKILYLASEPVTDKIVWEQGNKYTFRLNTSTAMQAAMIAPLAAKMQRKRWAVVYPNYEMGQAAIAAFKKQLLKLQPDVEFVSAQPVPVGKIDAAATVQALLNDKPDAIFSAIWGGDLLRFLREGRSRGLLNDDLKVASLFLGEPEYLDFLGKEAPVGWTVLGYPWYDLKTPENEKFVKAYQAKFKDHPRRGSVVGYTAIYAIAAAIKKAGSTDTEAMIKALSGLDLTSPTGPVHFRPIDHQSTLGIYAGEVALRDDKGIMVNWKFLDGKDYQPSDEEVLKLRPKK
ncbi:ABC transporter substrate-binding protein [Eoetvoesiella caeni]